MANNKAWMKAYTQGSKSLQDRLGRVHKNNPEFQDFIKQHGLGTNLSVKQSGQQKKSTSIGSVKPVTDANPERGNLDRLAIIKAAAEKQRNRRQANSNRVAFGGELGGGFQMPGSGFRRYSESLDESNMPASIIKIKQKFAEKSPEDLHAAFKEVSGRTGKSVEQIARSVARRHGHKDDGVYWNRIRGTDEEVNYGDATYTTRRGGWVVKRNGKIASAVLPSEKNAQEFINSTRMTLSRKVASVVRKKAKDIARGLGRMSLATESAENRRRILSYDSAILPPEREHPLMVPHPKKKLDALRAAGKHVEARELERNWLRKAMAKQKSTENSNEQ